MEARLRAHAREMETLEAMGAAYDGSQTRKRRETGNYPLLPFLSLSLHLPPTKRLCASNYRSKTKLLLHDMIRTPMSGMVFQSSPPNLEDSAPPQVVDSHESSTTKNPNHSSELITQVVDPHGSSTPTSSETTTGTEMVDSHESSISPSSSSEDTRHVVGSEEPSTKGTYALPVVDSLESSATPNLDTTSEIEVVDSTESSTIFNVQNRFEIQLVDSHESSIIRTFEAVHSQESSDISPRNATGSPGGPLVVQPRNVPLNWLLGLRRHYGPPQQPTKKPKAHSLVVVSNVDDAPRTPPPRKPYAVYIPYREYEVYPYNLNVGMVPTGERSGEFPNEDPRA